MFAIAIDLRMRYTLFIQSNKKKSKGKMKNNIPADQRDHIRNEIKSFIYKDSKSVSAFCRKHGMSRAPIDKWYGDDRLPSIQVALKLEKISKGELTKEFLCPNVEWNE